MTQATRVIAWREFANLLGTPLAWFVGAVLAFLSAWVFFIQLDTFQTVAPRLALLDQGPGLTDIAVAPLLAATGFIGAFLAPLLTMRQLAEERRNGTLVLLLAAPVSSSAIVLGKFLGLLGLLGLLALMVGAMPLALLAGGSLDLAQLGCGLLGLVLLLAAFGAAGLFFSSLTAQPVLAALGSFGLLLFFQLVNLAGSGEEPNLLRELSVVRHLEPLLRGLVRTVDVAYFLLLTALFLGLTVWRLEAGRLGAGSRATRWAGHVGAGLLVVAVALLGAVAERHGRAWDLTAAGRHSLSPESLALLRGLEGPLRVTAYVREQGEWRSLVGDLLARYQRAAPGVTVSFVNPDAVPDELRRLGISSEAELVLSHAGRSEHVTDLSEAGVSNAIARLLREEERWVVFLDGHGERDPEGRANHDLGDWVARLGERGVRVRSLSLAQTGAVPDNTSLLVIASPRIPLLEPETQAVLTFVERGGNLLWLLEPDGLAGLEPLAERLGLAVAPGRLVDPSARQLGIEQPDVVLVGSYPDHPALGGLRYVTLFPEAAGLLASDHPDWATAALLETAGSGWSESAFEPGGAEPRFDPGRDLAGPLPLGLALTRRGEAPAPLARQRIVVIGDGDFLSNAFLGNGGNLELGSRLVEWALGERALLDIPPRRAPDTTLELSRTATLVMGFGFLLGLPFALALTGTALWLRRRRL